MNYSVMGYVVQLRLGRGGSQHKIRPGVFYVRTVSALHHLVANSRGRDAKGHEGLVLGGGAPGVEKSDSHSRASSASWWAVPLIITKGRGICPGESCLMQDEPEAGVRF